ncbi:MAG: hypothetical protein ACTHNY_05575 [Solirubrobacterales bacterium]
MEEALLPLSVGFFLTFALPLFGELDPVGNYRQTLFGAVKQLAPRVRDDRPLPIG